MRQPERFISAGQEKLACNLKRSIYSLKQSPRCCNCVLDSQLKSIGFAQIIITSDPCLYLSTEGEMFIIAVYVDDIVLAGKGKQGISEVKDALASRFEVKDMGDYTIFWVQRLCRIKEWCCLGRSTGLYRNKFGMENAKSVSIPVDTGTKLIKSTDGSEGVDQRLYQSAVGSLLYLFTVTRLDITYAVSSVAKFCAEPNRQHWTACKTNPTLPQGYC